MKLTLDEESVAEAVLYWAASKLDLGDDEDVDSVVMSLDDDKRITATIIIKEIEL